MHVPTRWIRPIGSLAAGLTIALLASLLRAGPAPVQENEVRRRSIVDKKNEELVVRERAFRVNQQFDRFLARALAGGETTVKSRGGGVKLKSPLDPASVKGFINHDDTPVKKRKMGRVFANVTAAADLISHFQDAKPDVTTRVQAGEKVEVVFMIKEPVKSELGTFRWCLVRRANGKEGYLPDRLMTNVPKRKRPLFRFRSSLPKKMFVRVGSSLTVRDSPSIHGEVVGNLYNDDAVMVQRYSEEKEEVNGERARWAYIRTAQGTEGWVFSLYLRSQNSTTKVKPENYAAGDRKFVRSPIARVRDEPSTYGTSVAVLKRGVQVSILQVTANKITVVGISAPWVEVEAGGVRGWVFGGFLSKDASSRVSFDNIYRPFIMPTGEYRQVTSKYGPRIHPIYGRRRPHTGIDIAAPRHARIRAAADGIVYKSAPSGGWGKLTIIEHSGNLFTWYAHQQVMKVKVGDRVTSGQVIGTVGTTGNSTGPHLHFEVRRGSRKHMDPQIFLPK